MANFKYTFKNVDNVIKDLLKDEQKFEQFMEQAVDDSGKLVESRSKKYCPVDTGKLRASIQRVKLAKFEQEVSANTEYARYVEYGTSRTREQSYMRVAGDEVQAMMPQIIIKGLKRYL